MVKIQLELTEKANKKLEAYVLYNKSQSKGEAINEILSDLDTKKNFKEWLEGVENE